MLATRQLPLTGLALSIALSYFYDMFEIAYSKKALNDLRKIPTNERRRIRSKIEDYAAAPEAHAHQVKKLKGRHGFRLRVGNWRVVFDKDGNFLDILEVGARGSIYG